MCGGALKLPLGEALSQQPWSSQRRGALLSDQRGWGFNPHFVFSIFWHPLPCFFFKLLHTVTQPFLDFRQKSLTPLLQEAHMDPIWLEFDVGQILVLGPSDIGAPGTLWGSHGTKNFGSKIFSYHPLMILFYGFCGLVMLKMPKIIKNCLFQHSS